MRGGKGVVPLCGCDIMEKTHQLLADQILLKQRKIFDGAEDDGVGEDGGVKRMGGKGG